MHHPFSRTFRTIVAVFALWALPLIGSVEQPGAWSPPLREPFRVSSAFDLPHGPYRAGHRGIDLPTSTGASVYAPVTGTVTYRGTVVDRQVLTMKIDENTLLSFEPLDSDLQPGDVIERGQLLGTVSAGGHCASACLHLGVRVNGTYVNPMRYFTKRPVLLPW